MDIDLSTTIPDEFCDCCNNKLNIFRTYLNGRKICPICYGREINKSPKEQKTVIIEKCPKCGYKQESK